MNKPVSERSKQRRRILQAAASVPVVMTLPSGAALAATSVTCDVKSVREFDTNASATFFPTDSGDPSSWMRVQLPGFEIKVTDQSSWEWGFEYEGTYYVFDNKDRREEAVAVVGGPYETQELMTGDQRVYFYGLVDYPSGGLIVEPGLVEEGGLNPIAGTSCWNSLTGASLQNNVVN